MKYIVDYHLECDLAVEVEAESQLEAVNKVADDIATGEIDADKVGVWQDRYEVSEV